MQFKLAEEIQNTDHVQNQLGLAAEINHAPTAQLWSRDDDDPTQRKTHPSTPAQLEEGPNRTGLPDQLKAGVENLSGISLNDVKVHYNSAKPAQLNALAYAQGTDIHVAPGQEQHLPHEAWHIVQQKQGQVKPTMQMKGRPVKDDHYVEFEADVMGQKALQRLATESEQALTVQSHQDKAMVRAAQNPQPVQRMLAWTGAANQEVVQLGVGASKVDESAVAEREYGKYVAEAVTKLSGKLAFGASPEGKFDTDHWEKVEDKEYKFAVRTKSKPSVALKALVQKPEKWSFDCAEFVEVCNLYARMMTYDDEVVDAERLVLRQHTSTPFLGGGVTFDRKAKDAKFDAIFPKRGNAVAENLITEAELLSALPIGARVCFKNPAAPDTPFRNENALVDGSGTFAAHPMGKGLSAETIVNRLVNYNIQEGLGGEDHGRALIFISQAEIFSSMFLSEATVSGLKLERLQEYF